MALRALIVDDSAEFLESAARLLESQGLVVVGCASNSDEALRLVEAHQPDVALIDVELGDEDGVALTAAVTRRVPTIRAVLISAHEQDDVDELISGGPAVGFLPKSLLGAAAIENLVG
jgi:DNA-binding NarL/FixJ family response regulator